MILNYLFSIFSETDWCFILLSEYLIFVSGKNNSKKSTGINFELKICTSIIHTIFHIHTENRVAPATKHKKLQKLRGEFANSHRDRALFFFSIYSFLLMEWLPSDK
jgi:hypothetical protein